VLVLVLVLVVVFVLALDCVKEGKGTMSSS
jgi:hypothetical protein